MPRHILSLDVGTSKLCALVWDEAAARVVALRTSPNDASVAGLPAGRHEQDPVQIVARIRALIHAVIADPAVDRHALAGIAITGQVHGALLVDGHGAALTNFITWRDQRTTDRVAAANEADPAGPLRCGGPLCAGYGGLLLAEWSQDRRIPNEARAVSLLDFLAFSLCGDWATDTTHAASWGLLDLRSNGWDEPRLRTLGIRRELLPPLRASAVPLAPLRAEHAREFGVEEMPVCAPVGDNQASVVGVAGFAPGGCVINLGTGGQISLARSDFAFVSPLETRPLPFGGFLHVGASLCGGEAYAVLARFVQECSDGMPVAEVYARLNERAACVGVDAGGLHFDTRFGGTRADASVRGALTGMGTRNFTVGNVARACVNGMVAELADLACRPGLPRAERLFASGNGVRRNPLVAPTLERAFGLPCVLSPHTEEAAVGAARCAARSLECS